MRLTPGLSRQGRLLPAYTLLGGWTIFSIAGLAYVFLGSFKTQRELIVRPWSWPDSLRLDNFAYAWWLGKLNIYFINSIFLVTVSVIVVLAISAPAAYVLTRGRFRFRNAVTNYLIMGIGIPIPLLYIPLFAILTRVGLSDSLLGLGLVFVATSIPFTVYLLTGFFSGIPSAIGDAGIMAGCTEWQLFAKIQLPLARSGLITAAIFNTIWLWNEYQLTIVLISSGNLKTVPLGLFALQNATQYSGNWTQLYAAVTIVVVPTLIVFVLFSEKIISRRDRRRR